MQKPLLLFLTSSSGFRADMIARGIMQACNENGLSFLWRVFTQVDIEHLDHQPIGIIFWANSGIERVRAEVRNAVPIVSTNGSTLDLPIPVVIPDSASIAEKISDHLVAEGLENFIFVGWKNPSVYWRADAIKASLRRRLKRFTFEFFQVGFESKFWGNDTGQGKAFIRLLQSMPKPLAVIGMNDQAAVSCIECVRLADLRIPQQVAVVGVDDHPLYSNMYVPLTTVRIDYSEVGRSAVRMVLDRQGAGYDPSAPDPEKRYITGELITRESSQLRLAHDPQIAKVLRHIHDNLTKPHTLAELAAVAGMSRTLLSVRFDSVVGESPIRYLVNQRLLHAKKLLSSTTLTVSEIAYQSGFEDRSYFVRSFKKYTGMSPSDYRRSLLTPK